MNPFTHPSGNAFAILGRTTRALRHAGLDQDEIDQYYAEATSGDYDHLLQTTMRWVDWESSPGTPPSRSAGVP